ncbi:MULTISPECIES: hypothetical protein [unclassified Streptomyces]|uniref:hypothetical protein n=1 Tax=unclassified Streptomyces TaxID=2593676 RepID=UPI002DDADF29|nr:hypothetical protein [Streptomyces sp. NBC_01445]WSE11473.1 hypothetical protein OG574_50710 [Streptomyces sp. NBC_01445]
MPSLHSTLAVAATVAALTLGQSSAQAAVPPEHAIIVCQSASFYANYNSSTGPTGYLRTLPYGDKVGHTPGAHPVYNGWAATFDYGPNDWGYVRYECIGGYDSW